MPRRRSRRRIAVARTPVPRPEGANNRPSTDFVHVQLGDGRRFRVLTIVDDVTWECLAAVPETSLSGKRVVREMSALIARRGRPGAIVSGRHRHAIGPSNDGDSTDFSSAAVLVFTRATRLDWRYIAPGKPTVSVHGGGGVSGVGRGGHREVRLRACLRRLIHTGVAV